MKNFASLAFSDEVKSLQEKHGSRKAYERMEKQSMVDGLSAYEVDFIGQRDSFYMASIGENGFPYIQHRGGPKGFIKVIDANTIGFLDFSGNKQFITVGNLATHHNVSLIIMDYATRRRLKMYAKTEVVDLKAQPELLKLLALDDYHASPERIMILHIEAYDWNCPQHITVRFSHQEIENLMAPQREYIKKLELELKQLKGE
ncbi:pyridoxamine 5'-phosphate oxidase family protein [Roseivirga sp.]|uniref:pyridoxamine 5'-phosphate oxidase family protein n=1 Tax=Roseivirga sp. TaxID=1964215 RepID=UPI002B2768BD|nr:pyridoxamine 5'-phosphate oxidase family protein [Roseivirga sp.]